MLPFRLRITPGESAYKQIVYAATKAVISGELAVGSRFPSVRELSQELKVNPNTAHKAVAELIRDGLIQSMPGVGTVVCEPPRSSPADRARLLSIEVEQLVVAARRLGLSEADVVDAVQASWVELTASGNRVGSDAERDIEEATISGRKTS